VFVAKQMTFKGNTLEVCLVKISSLVFSRRDTGSDHEGEMTEFYLSR